MKGKNALVNGMRVGNLIARKKFALRKNELREVLLRDNDYYNIKFVQSLVTKRNLIHTLDALDYKAHVSFLRKIKDYKCALWSEKYGTYLALPIVSTTC